MPVNDRLHTEKYHSVAKKSDYFALSLLNNCLIFKTKNIFLIIINNLKIYLLMILVKLIISKTQNKNLFSFRRIL